MQNGTAVKISRRDALASRSDQIVMTKCGTEKCIDPGCRIESSEKQMWNGAQARFEVRSRCEQSVLDRPTTEHVLGINHFGRGLGEYEFVTADPTCKALKYRLITPVLHSDFPDERLKK